ncbi:MAG: hypothetical protein Q7J85_07955 [Bacillota bacterium]|nr:hypothetical protein [Bacillota bacterium]
MALEYLKDEKGLKEETAGQKANMAAFFIMDFLFVYYDVSVTKGSTAFV